MAKPVSKKKNKVSPEEAQSNAAAIRRLWMMGKRSLARLEKLGRADPEALKHGSKEGTFKQESERMSLGNIDTAAKARRVAEQYAPEQIDSLCDLVEWHRSRFSVANLLVLLRIDDRRRRDALMRKAIRDSWTSSRLESAVQAIRGQRRQSVGRDPHVPEDPVERLLRLDALAAKWCRWCEAAQDMLPADLKALVIKATGAVEKVQKAIAKKLPPPVEQQAKSQRRTPKKPPARKSGSLLPDFFE